MGDNRIANELRIIGVAIAVVGIIASIIIYANDSLLVPAMISGIIGSIVFGLVLVGFSEIINLLQ